MVIVPVVAVSLVAQRALQAAMRCGGEVVPVAVDIDPEGTRSLRAVWAQWNPGVALKILPSPHHNLVAPIVGFVRTQIAKGRTVTVLIAEVAPRRRRYQLLHNQRGPILAAALRARTDAVVATIVVRVD